VGFDSGTGDIRLGDGLRDVSDFAFGGERSRCLGDGYKSASVDPRGLKGSLGGGVYRSAAVELRGLTRSLADCECESASRGLPVTTSSSDSIHSQ
jgi:hypothetical protein